MKRTTAKETNLIRLKNRDRNRRRASFLMTLILVLGLSVSAHAALVDMGDGTIYDTDRQLSWLQDANYALTSGYPSVNGLMTWSEAMTWADNLFFAGFNNWRLPFTPQTDLSCTDGVATGGNCTGGEMGHLYYTELGNPGGGPLTNTGNFTNLPPRGYWSQTGYFLFDVFMGYFAFDFRIGSQELFDGGGYFYALAVRSGARSVATATLSVAMQGTGSGTLTSSPYSGINCGSNCTGLYKIGTAVTLTATPALGSVFTGWSGDADCSDGVVTMDADKTCSATFRQAISGTVGGLTPAKVICRNLSTRQSITIQDGQKSWNCEAAGLAVHPGESLEIIIKGTAD